MAAELALGADGKTEGEGDRDAEGEVELAAEVRLSASAGAFSGPVLSAGLVFRARLVG